MDYLWGLCRDDDDYDFDELNDYDYGLNEPYELEWEYDPDNTWCDGCYDCAFWLNEAETC